MGVVQKWGGFAAQVGGVRVIALWILRSIRVAGRSGLIQNRPRQQSPQHRCSVCEVGFRLVINRFQDPFRQTQAHLGVREFGQGEGVISHELFLISLGRLRGLEGL